MLWFFKITKVDVCGRPLSQIHAVINVCHKREKIFVAFKVAFLSTQVVRLTENGLDHFKFCVKI